VTGTQIKAMEYFKGGPINRAEGDTLYIRVEEDPALSGTDTIHLATNQLETLAANPGDLLYVCDRRWWFGGLRSFHTKAGEPVDGNVLRLSPEAMTRAHFSDGDMVYVEKVF
jgi:hypothetical protein